MNDTPISFETERIFARPWKMEDAEDALRIYGHPDVTKYLPKVKANSIEEMRERLEKIIKRDSEWADEIGSFASFDRQSGQLLGNLMIKPLPNNEGHSTDDIEIGWHLAREYWGRGLATEGARKLLEIGFEQLGLDEIFAVVNSANEKSMAVARRLGMEYQGQSDQYYSETVEVFRLDRSQWSRGRRTAVGDWENS